MMSRRILLPAVATGLAVVVFLATFRLGGGSTAPDPGRPAIDLGSVQGPRISLDQLDPANSAQPIGDTGRFHVDRINKNGQLITFMADQYDPQPDGVADVRMMDVFVHLVRGKRVLAIRADAGTFIAPDNQPRQGTLRGNVRLSLYDTTDLDRAANLAEDSPDVKLRVYLDADTRFDVELGQVDCDGPIHLTGHRFDFQGTGLSLNFNSRRNRIEQLSVQKGKALRFRPGSDEFRSPPPAVADSDSEPAPGPANVDAGTATVEADTADDPSRVQYYRAAFQSTVVVKSPTMTLRGDRLHAWFSFNSRSDSDRIVDGLSDAGMSQPRPTGPTTFGQPTWLALAAVPGDDEVDRLLDRARIPRTPEQRTMLPAASDDVTVTWVGPLLIEPMERRHEDLQGPGDVLLSMTGSPVHIRTVEHETIDARQVEYLASRERVRLTGIERSPLVIHAPKLGVFTGQQFTLDQSTGIGRVEGPGEMRAYGSSELLREVSKSDSIMPGGMTVRWRGGIDLTFHRKPPAADRSADEAGLASLQSARFREDVQIDHPQFQLTADAFELGLDAPHGEQAQALNDVLATGDVHVRSVGRFDQPPFDLKSQKLRIELEPDADGKVQPTRMLAEQDVAVSEPGRTLYAGHLDVELGREVPLVLDGPAPVLPATRDPNDAAALGPSMLTPLGLFDPVPSAEAVPTDALEPRPAPDAAATDDTASPQLVIRSMRARDAVRIVLDEQSLRIAADRLTADAARQQLEVFGSADRPAVMVRDDGILRGEHIIVSQADETIHVRGPGQLEFFSVPNEDAPSADTAAADADRDVADPADDNPIAQALAKAIAEAEAARRAATDPTRNAKPRRKTRVLTTWTDTMSFESRTLIARFAGNVESNGRFDLDTMHLKAAQLMIDFRDGAPSSRTAIDQPFALPGSGAAEAPGERTRAAEQLLVGNRAISRMVATKDVTFEADTWADKPGGERLTSVRITGPVMTFDNQPDHQQFLVDGAGTMTLVDRRPNEKSDTASAKPAASDKPTTRIAVSGRGDTLFKWTGSLRYDAIANDMVMHSGVQMAHRDAATGDVVRLDCRRLVMDFVEVAGLGVWVSGDTPQPQVRAIDAIDSVRLVSKTRTATTSHLTYDASADTVRLRTAEGDSLSQVTDGPHTLTAQQFTWDLTRDRITIDKPGATRLRP